jgi:hypothetical protein
MIQPNSTHQSKVAVKKNKAAAMMRPWQSCPSPGYIKLAIAEITFPVDPCPFISNVPAKGIQKTIGIFLVSL